MNGISAPRAKKQPTEIIVHGDVRQDEYFWLREKENPEVLQHLRDENTYVESVLTPHQKFREDLFNELKARIKEDDLEVPVKRESYFYYSRTLPGQQYAIYCRKYLSLDAPEEIVLDCNELARGQKYFKLGTYEVSPDHQWLAFSVDLDGSEEFILTFKNLTNQTLSPEKILKSSNSVAWAQDNQTVFYTLLDENHRPNRIMRHQLGTDPASDVLIYREEDTQIFTYCFKSRSQKYIFIGLYGKVTSEFHFLEAAHPLQNFQVIEPRRRGVLYQVDHRDNQFFILTNDRLKNFRLCVAPVTNPGASSWQEVHSGDTELFLQDFDVFRDHVVLTEQKAGLTQIRVMNLNDSNQHLIDFPEPAFVATVHTNPEFNTTTLRFSYTSLVTPNSVFDYEMNTRTRETKKIQEIPSGYDPALYQSERIFATAPDGTKIPISLVYRRDFRKTGTLPLYLYGYGSYGHSMTAQFSTVRLSLLNRGMIFAIAHVRGGSDMGRQWYDDGKFLKKKNTFTDFIACAEHLIAQKFTRAGDIVISGGSAGGMLVAAAINLAPQLFRGAVAKVPFVDVLNTMLDTSLPLTTTEFEEWGNPQDPTYYHYIKSYSPYDNIEAKDYPHILITAGLNDPRVTYWEPAKWVARLRELKTDAHLLLFYTHMDAGHGGSSGRYDMLKDVALEYTFVFKIFDLLG